MPTEPYSAPAGALWAAPEASGRLDAVVRLPGSKSMTNRELVLAALAHGPSRLRRPMLARDSRLMIAALRSLGIGVEETGGDLVVTPGPLRGGAAVDVGLAGTLMRFLPPVAALADGPVAFDGDEGARLRPMATTILALRALGVEVDDDHRAALPFTVLGTGAVTGGEVVIDASQSSQFVSGLLLAAARFRDGLILEHRGAHLPSLPHIAMTVEALQHRGVKAQAETGEGFGRWTVPAHRIAARDAPIEPDLSNAAPFLAAALVAGGRVTIAEWPARTVQVGDRLRDLLAAFGATVHRGRHGLTADGGLGVAGGRRPHPVDLDLGEASELVPTLAGLAALADGTSVFRGIAHMRGHETDRLAALVGDLATVGIAAHETADGLVVEGGAPETTGRPWRSHADHRMATTGALLGLVTPGLAVEDLAATTKTLQDFEGLWRRMLS